MDVISWYMLSAVQLERSPERRERGGNEPGMAAMDTRRGNLAAATVPFDQDVTHERKESRWPLPPPPSTGQQYNHHRLLSTPVRSLSRAVLRPRPMDSHRKCCSSPGPGPQLYGVVEGR